MKPVLPKILLLIFCVLSLGRLDAADRYWVHPTFYQNTFSTAAELAEWQLIEDDGTGGFALSGLGTAILTMDDAAGGFANRLFNINGASPRLMPFDGVNGRMELLVKSITGGNQRIFLQAQEFDGLGTYLGQVDILPAQNATGFFSVNLSAVTWDPSTAQLRFIIGGENYSAQQGTAEFAYFSYSNTANNWNNSANWSATSGGPGGVSVPGPSDNAIFDGAGGDNGSCLLDINTGVNHLSLSNMYSGNIDLQNFPLTVGAGGVNLDGGGITGESQNLQVNGNVAISGGAFKNPSGSTFIGGDVIITGGILNFDSGTVVFNGSIDQQFSSSVIVPVNNFVVNKPSGSVNFSSNILVADSLVLTQGILNTNSNSVYLGISNSSPGTLVAGSGIINGNFVRWIGPGSAGNLLFPLGNVMATAPLTILIVASPSTGGTISASYADAAPGFTGVSFADNATTITQLSTASWTVHASGIGDGNYTLSLSNNHLGAISDLATLDLTLGNGVVGVYQPATGTLTNPIFDRSGLTAANLSNTFFAGIASVPLPITWLSFDISEQQETYTWDWSLSFEQNVAWYEPQYSTDGIHFMAVGKISQLNNDHMYHYSSMLPLTGTIYFRVEEMDLDGKTSFSLIRTMSASPIPSFSLYPNPVKEKVTLNWPYPDATTIHTFIYNNLGNPVVARIDSYTPYLDVFVGMLPAGNYFILCTDDKNRSSTPHLLVKL